MENNVELSREERRENFNMEVADAVSQAERILSGTCIHCGNGGRKYGTTIFCYDCGYTIPIKISSQYKAHTKRSRFHYA